MNIYQKIQDLRLELQDLNIKKSGKNNFAGFKYYELSDILPHLNILFVKYKLTSVFTMTDEKAELIIINTENPEQKVSFQSPVRDANIKGTTPVQSLGGVHTYLKRYLYLNAFEISENDSLDVHVGSTKIEVKKATESQVELMLEKLEKERIQKVLTHFGVKSLKDLTMDQASRVLRSVR